MGTGTSQGVPMIALDAEHLDLADPRNWRTRTSIHVVMDGLHVQVDAGQEFRLQCLRNRIEWIDLFLLTHGHADHLLGMDDLRRFCDLRGGEALPVYSTLEALERVKAIYPYAIREKPEFRGYPAFRLLTMPPCLELPQGKIESVLLPHGRVQTLGFVFTENSTGRRAAYFTDCKTVPVEAQALAYQADLVILDALRPLEHPTHMNIAEAVAMAETLKACQSWFVHMTCHVDHAQEQAKLPRGMRFAWDGARVLLS